MLPCFSCSVFPLLCFTSSTLKNETLAARRRDARCPLLAEQASSLTEGALFVSESHDRLHAGGAARRNVTRHKHHNHQQARDDNESNRIGRLHAVQLAPHHPRQQQSSRDPDG